jgi:hypothetical protein
MGYFLSKIISLSINELRFEAKNSYQKACLYGILFVVLYVTKNERYE